MGRMWNSSCWLELKIIPHPGMGQVKQQPLGIKKTQRCGGKAWGFTQLGKSVSPE